MKTKYILLLQFFALFCSGQDYALSKIADSLSTHSKAVIRLESTSLDFESFDKLKVKRRYTVTIFRKDGLDYMYEPIYYNKQTKNLSYSAEVFDSNGKRIKKLKKKDFQDLSASGNSTLYAEDRVLIAEYTPTEYPFTISYTYSYDTRSTAHMPRWIPIKSYNIGIEKSVYTFTNRTNVNVLKKELNFDLFDIIKKVSQNTFEYSLNNQKPLIHEVLSPHLITQIPRVFISPQKFKLAGYKGQYSSWQELGKWFYDDLIEGRQALPDEEIEKIKAITLGINDPKEKIRLLYQYMQNKTRYINVSIGIGGWQPYPANYVSQKGYGDCKALSNYMMALLEVVNIPSNFTIVYGDKDVRRDILPDFPALQGNHAILNVPLKNDTIWLECTSQTTAFNHLGNFTNDRYALSLGPNGGKVVRTQIYPDELNVQTIKGNAQISTSGQLKLDFTHITTGLQYDWNYNIFYSDKEEQLRWLEGKYDQIKSKKFVSFAFINDQTDAKFIQKIELTSDAFVQVSDDHLIFPVVPVGVFPTTIKKDSFRKHPIYIQNGFKDVSSFQIQVPENYSLSYKPESISLETKFGSYNLSYQLDNYIIYVERELHIKKGTFNKDSYANYVDFRRSIEKADNTKILLEKL